LTTNGSAFRERRVNRAVFISAGLRASEESRTYLFDRASRIRLGDFAPRPVEALPTALPMNLSGLPRHQWMT
jgi:hypothetical protein